jgi:hypothetical protein
VGVVVVVGGVMVLGGVGGVGVVVVALLLYELHPWTTSVKSCPKWTGTRLLLFSTVMVMTVKKRNVHFLVSVRRHKDEHNVLLHQFGTDITFHFC